MKHPKKIYLPNDKRMFDVYVSNLLEDDIPYISIDYLKNWIEENIQPNYGGTGDIINTEEFLKYIEEEEIIYKI